MSLKWMGLEVKLVRHLYYQKEKSYQGLRTHPELLCEWGCLLVLDSDLRDRLLIGTPQGAPEMLCSNEDSGSHFCMFFCFPLGHQHLFERNLHHCLVSHCLQLLPYTRAPKYIQQMLINLMKDCQSTYSETSRCSSCWSKFPPWSCWLCQLLEYRASDTVY